MFSDSNSRHVQKKLFRIIVWNNEILIEKKFEWTTEMGNWRMCRIMLKMNANEPIDYLYAGHSSSGRLDLFLSSKFIILWWRLNSKKYQNRTIQSTFYELKLIKLIKLIIYLILLDDLGGQQIYVSKANAFKRG